MTRLALLLIAGIALYLALSWLSFRWLGHPKGSRLLPEHRRLLDGGLA